MNSSSCDQEKSEEINCPSPGKKQIIFINDPDEDKKEETATEEPSVEELSAEEPSVEKNSAEEPNPRIDMVFGVEFEPPIPAEEVSVFEPLELKKGTAFFSRSGSLMAALEACLLLILVIFAFLMTRMTVHPDEYNIFMRIRNAQRSATDINIYSMGVMGDIPENVISAIDMPYVDPSLIHKVRIGSQVVMSDVREVDISGTDLTKFNMQEALDQLPYLRKLTLIDCGLTNEEYAALQDEYPRIKMIWEIVLSHWTIRTDAVAFSTMKSTDALFDMNNSEAYYLRYCTDLVALDIGHNHVSDLSFLNYMPDLKILILVDNFDDNAEQPLTRISDLSAIGSCKKLRYLEIFSNNVSDLSFLKDLKEIEDLNISYTYTDSIEYLTDFPKLRRLWMEHTYLTEEECLTLIALYPDAEIIYQGTGSVDQGWRTAPQYETIRHMFSENVIDPEYED